MVRWTVGVVVSVSLFAAACAAPGTQVTEPGPSTTTATTTIPGGTVLSAHCGRAVFPYGTTEPTGAPFDADAQRAFDQAGEAVAEEWFGEGLGFGGGWEWVVVERDDTRMVFAGTGPNGFADVTVERQGDTWQAAGWGGCHFLTATNLPGFGIGAWVTDPDSAPDPQSSTLDVLLMERACAGGEPPVGREIRPVVIAHEDSIEIVVLIEGVQGVATCPSNPWYPTTIDVGEPIGDRTLVDRHVSPGLLRPWPPTETSLSGLGEAE